MESVDVDVFLDVDHILWALIGHVDKFCTVKLDR